MTFTIQQREQRMAKHTQEGIAILLRRAYQDANPKREWLKKERQEMKADLDEILNQLGINDLSEVLDDQGNIKPGVLR